TSVCSAVGLLPAALLGIDVHALLSGAAAMDAWTRTTAVRRNPATLLAAFWWTQTGPGKPVRAMVTLPYRDRLQLLSRYLQQLVMESLGKKLDRNGREVWQGLTVYGNKGSTDQHAYVQQLRDGRHDFFALFLRVLADEPGPQLEVEPGVRTGDCLDGFYQGTRAALDEHGRQSATLVLNHLNATTLGALIALFERTVGVYAEMLDINAYHQPGVEAGKQAARSRLALQARLLASLGDTPQTCEALADATEAPPLHVWQILRRLVATARAEQSGSEPQTALFRAGR
ncbi:MAG: glucose-6-phosphate isomerase, partial [Nannocystaceae bacterium]